MELNENPLEMDVNTQADELFQVFMKKWKDNDAVVIEAEDSEKREITANLISPNILRKYKSYKATVTITPKDDGNSSLVKWTFKTEKIPDGDIHHDPYVSIKPKLKTVEICRKSPADELFKAYMEALKDDDEVEIEAEDWENREMTIKLICTDTWKKYKTLKVTIVITPTDGGCSHAKCTGVFEQFPDDPCLSIKSTVCLFKMVDAKLLKLN